MNEATNAENKEINKYPFLVIRHVTYWLIAREIIKFLNGKQDTEQAIEVIATYHILKAIYSRSIIRRYESQLSFMAARCKLTVPALQDYLHKLQKMELLSITRQDISLSVYADHIPGDKEFLYDSEGEKSLSQILSAWREECLGLNYQDPFEIEHIPQKRNKKK